MSCSYNQNDLPARVAEYVKGVAVYSGTAALRIAREHDSFWQNEICEGLREYGDDCRQLRTRDDSDNDWPRVWTSESHQWSASLAVMCDAAPAPQPTRRNVQPARHSARPYWHDTYEPDYQWNSVYGASKLDAPPLS